MTNSWRNALGYLCGMLIKSASFPAGCFGGWPLRWLAALVAGRFSGWLLQWLAGCFSGRPLQWLASCFSGWPLRWLAASSCFILFVLTTLSLASVGVRYHCGDFPGCMVLWDSGLRLKKLDAALPLRPLAGSEPTFPAGRFGGWPLRWLAASVAGHFGGWPLRWLAGRFGGWPAASVAGWPLRWLAAS